jgi:hypothetical protein
MPSIFTTAVGQIRLISLSWLECLPSLRLGLLSALWKVLERIRALQKTMMIALGLLASCKPSGDISSMKAVSAADGKIAYTIVPVRNFFDQSQTANVQSSPVSATLLQSLTIGAVRCEGATAKIDAVLLEMSLVNTGVTLLRKGSAVYQNNDDGPTLVNRCKLFGSYVGCAASVVSLNPTSHSNRKEDWMFGDSIS